MTNALIKTSPGGRTHIVPLVPTRVTSHLGAGTLRYITDDRYAGVHLDGDPERRVEEIALEHLTGGGAADLLAAVAS